VLSEKLNILQKKTMNAANVMLGVVKRSGLDGVSCINVYLCLPIDLQVDLLKFVHSVFVWGLILARLASLSQLDPPDSRSLFLKAASLSFLNEEVWGASSARQGRYLRIL
jgi:hypothetical protein